MAYGRRGNSRIAKNATSTKKYVLSILNYPFSILLSLA